MKNLSDRLITARKNAGYRSAREAAERLEWTYSTYASHENGSRIPKLHVIRKYARAFNVSPQWILNGDNNDAFSKNAGGNILKVPIVGQVQAGTLF